MTELLAMMIWICGSKDNVEKYTVEPGQRIEIVCKGKKENSSSGTIQVLPWNGSVTVPVDGTSGNTLSGKVGK